jgi:hypothetical protein
MRKGDIFTLGTCTYKITSISDNKNYADLIYLGETLNGKFVKAEVNQTYNNENIARLIKYNDFKLLVLTINPRFKDYVTAEKSIDGIKYIRVTRSSKRKSKFALKKKFKTKRYTPEIANKLKSKKNGNTYKVTKYQDNQNIPNFGKFFVENHGYLTTKQIRKRFTEIK